MRIHLALSAFVLLALLAVPGMGLADEHTETHVNVYNDTGEPIEFKLDRLNRSGRLEPGGHAYFRDYPTAYYLKKTTYAYVIEFTYAYNQKATARCVVVNQTDAVGTPKVDDWDHEADTRGVPFWDIDITTKHDSNQVNFYVHVRDK